VTSFASRFNGVQVIERIEPLAHDLSLSPLHSDLVSGQRSEENEEADTIEYTPVCPDLRDACSHHIWEVVLLDE
jgi:hypothetical protein